MSFDLQLMHGFDFHRDSGDLAGAFVTEKMDGWRVRWTGARLFTRKGVELNPPSCFTAELPPLPLDAELFAGYGQRNAVCRLLASRVQNWRGMKLMIFDGPTLCGDFGARHEKLMGLRVGGCAEVVAMARLFSMNQLPTMLASVTSRGGEGLMISRAGAPYASGRSNRLLKLKPQHLPEFHTRDLRCIAV